ncbi:MAG: type II toxin-antitoxin system RelE/ParE family toxin [gamma proteobacterium endosymbiont of Lamellibrachia anaximandri]|nr:type II toxin-antitoxin system RelE/ParE family toxin [gamma proteobacterium endosymbiont of Lamellibrachia anaximandri]MBL3619746.1 type II toxin-antitoxin system RelE/ParE family toxin [gamma proteobacterium endosymbiont of Lamellibrachia anaximandri]
MRIVYSPESIEDLSRLKEFIEKHNPQAAKRISQSIIKGIKQLKTFPMLGVEVTRAPNPEMMRDLIIGNYVVRYLVYDETIYILRVWHHKENRL